MTVDLRELLKLLNKVNIADVNANALADLVAREGSTDEKLAYKAVCDALSDARVQLSEICERGTS